MSCVMINHSFT